MIRKEIPTVTCFFPHSVSEHPDDPSLKETLVTKPKPRGFRVSTFSLQERQTLSNF